ncbi:MAG: (E)-4-hydroxy-3-methylbut-2-enyl-diphosphate synthase [Chloroflexota bacterium]
MLSLTRPYVPSVYAYRRRHTREVMVGDVGVGGNNPIRVQSMTTTLTKDIPATVDQAERLVRAGCEIVRITTPTPADARCLGPIKEQLAARGITVPIVADIHFNPLAALAAAEFADKVRVNPGNYTDSRKFAIREYSDKQYEDELARVEDRFAPLVLKCKDRGIAMRIGTNHGSLSDRIMNRFGDTPEGMVESALEFVRICEKYEFHDIILSMKASNPKVMIAANRLLAARMAEVEMDYPFHLGVTEAGNAEDGRIKSAIGIGSLLEDGIGDTIRVSLTEEPEAEIPVALALASRYERPSMKSQVVPLSVEVPWDPFRYERRPSVEVPLGDVRLGAANPVAVFTTLDGPLAQRRTAMAHILRWASPAGRRQPKPDVAVLSIQRDDDLVVLQHIAVRLRAWPQARLSVVAASDDTALLMDSLTDVDGVLVHATADTNVSLLASAVRDAGKNLMLATAIESADDVPGAIDALLDAAVDASDAKCHVLLSLQSLPDDAIHAYRMLAARAAERGIPAPIVLGVTAGSDPLLAESIALGSPLCDGIGDAVMISGMEDSSDLAFLILQSSGTRLFKTDYVACPSCGRTLSASPETTERRQQRPSQLVGGQLAIMGCIVPGPGEMADADFGYVGGAPGQVNLYVGKECIEKGVPAEEADDRLVRLIKAHGKWQEPDAE